LVVLPRSTAQATSVAQELSVRHGGDVRTQEVGLSGRVLLVQVPAGREDEYKAKLAADPTVAAVARNYKVRADADPLTPDDPGFAQQWGLTAIRAPEAWGDGARATGVTVAVIDSGADYGHPDLAGSLLAGCSFVVTPMVCGPTAAADDNGHGTHVAGTIAALTNNGVGVVGLAWGASILPLKALDSGGTGSWFSIADAIGYATNQPGVRVINMSLGSDPNFPPDASDRALLQSMIDGARAKGILVVVASGNSGANLDVTPVYPASLAGVVAVTAVAQDGSKPGWANYGSAVAVAAPGVGIYSTLCSYSAATKSCNHSYGMKSGTSMASPHVAALAALLIARTPTATPEGITATMRATAADLGAPGPDSTFGAGRIDVASALVGRSLILTSAGPGTAQSNPATSAVEPDSIVTLTATANTNATFTGWLVDGVFSNWSSPFTLRMDDSHVVVATFAPRASFADLAPDQIGEATVQLASRDIVRGYGDGTYGPSDTVLRAQVAGLLVRAMSWEGERHPSTFSDQGTVDNDLWAAVGILAHYQVAKGYGDNTYHPTDELLHIQAISVVSRAMVARGYWSAATGDDRAIYPNVPSSSGHRLDLLTFVQNAGAVPDRPTNNAAAWGDWDTPASRGWFARVLWQALNATFGVNPGP
jgi:subtilisin family serine protease